MLILSSRCAILSGQRFCNPHFALLPWTRTLFSEKTLRITDYESHRLRLVDIKFNTKALVFTLRTRNFGGLIDGTKQWVHSMDRRTCETEFQLLLQCLRFILENSKQSTEPTYDFGPAVMRMFHFLNLPDHAIQVYRDLILKDMFQKLSCTIILCDLLFNNGMYNDVVDIIQRQIAECKRKGMNSSRFQNYLLFASCYKLNTPESLKIALNVWNSCVKHHQLDQNKQLLSTLAINQGQPKIALEILPPIDKHFTSTNVRLLAFSESGQFDEMMKILQNILYNESMKNHKISNEVIKRIKLNIEKNGSEKHLAEFMRFTEEASQRNRLSKVTLDDMLCWPIDYKFENRKSKTQQQSQSQ